MMDVSGSMTDDQKEIVRTEAFWIDTWLTSQYDGVEVRYIIHDAVAREVDEANILPHPRKWRHAHQLGLQSGASTSFAANTTRPNGTFTASNFPTATTGAKTTTKACSLWARNCCPTVNLFCYGQVESPYGSGEYIRALKSTLRRQTRKAGALGN